MSYIANTDQPSKANGQYHSLKGTVVEMIGDAIGATSWQQSGREEHAQGETEWDAAQAKDYVDGTADRLGGKVDAVVGAVTDDRQQELSGNLRHDQGRAKQELNKPTA